MLDVSFRFLAILKCNGETMNALGQHEQALILCWT
jgi:hypothetical protein